MHHERARSQQIFHVSERAFVLHRIRDTHLLILAPMGEPLDWSLAPSALNARKHARRAKLQSGLQITPQNERHPTFEKDASVEKQSMTPIGGEHGIGL